MRITKALKTQFEEKAKQLVGECNPYTKKAIAYFIGGKQMFLGFDNQSFTKEEIDQNYFETACKDIQRGYEERMVGWYDKWYRYSRTDEGRAYDAGQRMAADNPKCPAEFNIIEIAECNK